MNPGKNVQLMCDTTGTGAQADVIIQLGGAVEASVVTDITVGPGTIRIQGQIDPTAPWVDFTGDITTTGLTNISKCWPRMRVNVLSNSGRIVAWIMA